MPLVRDTHELLDIARRPLWVSDEVRTDSGAWVGVFVITPDYYYDNPTFEITFPFEAVTDLTDSDWIKFSPGLIVENDNRRILTERDLERLADRLDVSVMLGELWEKLATLEEMSRR